MKNFWTLFICILSSLPALGVPVISGGEYSCVLKESSPYFNNRPYFLEIKKNGPHAVNDRLARFSQDSTTLAEGVYNSRYKYFEVKENTFPRLPYKTYLDPYMKFSYNYEFGYEKENPEHLTWEIHLKTSEQSYSILDQRIPFDCRLVRGLTIADIRTSYQMSCRTFESLNDSRYLDTAKFTFERIQATGGVRLLNKIVLLPEDSPLAALNFNTRISDQEGDVLISGKRDDKELVELRLEKRKKYYSGSVQVLNQQSPTKSHGSRLSCRMWTETTVN